jgi:hypothetical protein
MAAGDGARTVEAWTARRRRAEALQSRYPFARGLLSLYGALLDVQERAYAAARAEGLAAGEVPAYAARSVLPAVLTITARHGPERLAEAVRDDDRWLADGEATVRRWLAGADQEPVERYLARAAAAPLLEALGPAAGEACAGPHDERHCPCCGGPPQVSVLAPGPEALSGAHRYLVCARCATRWPYPRLTCAACGERDAARLTVYAEGGTAEAETSGTVVRGLGGGPQPAPAAARPHFPHVRVEACGSCSRYLLGIDLTREPSAVPTVDELAALPLDLYAQERGLVKIVPNLMGV